MDKLDDIVAGVLLFVVFVFILVLAMALPTMYLWNALMPDLFGLQTITFWQAVMMNFLTTILFKTSNLNLGKDK